MSSQLNDSINMIAAWLSVLATHATFADWLGRRHTRPSNGPDEAFG